MPRSTWWNLPDEKRERVLEAARCEFGANGFSAGSLNGIAQRAEVAKGSLFQYFDDKLDLWLTLYEGDCRRVRERSERILSECGELPFFEQVRAMIKGRLGFYAENPSVCASSDAARREVHPEARPLAEGMRSPHATTSARSARSSRRDRRAVRCASTFSPRWSSPSSSGSAETLACSCSSSTVTLC